MAESKLLSKRINVRSMQDIVDQYGDQFAQYLHAASEKQKEEIKTALFAFLEIAAREIKDAAFKGCERGINEAVALVFDPDFHETVKKRNQRERERSKIWRGQSKTEEAERDRRKNNPTRAEKIADIRRAVSSMSYERRNYHQNRDLIMKYVSQDGNEILADFIKDELEAPGLDIQTFDIDSWVRSLSQCEISEKPKPKNKTLVNEVEDFFDNNMDFE